MDDTTVLSEVRRSLFTPIGYQLLFHSSFCDAVTATCAACTLTFAAVGPAEAGTHSYTLARTTRVKRIIANRVGVAIGVDAVAVSYSVGG